MTHRVVCKGGPPSKIASGLWQGGYPLTPRLPGFDVLVLCAEELQDGPFDIPVIPAPMDDTEDRRELPAIVETAREAANQIARYPGNVLVTCHLGKNRSGLVMGLTLVARGLSGAAALRLIQSRRPGALCNPLFADFLAKVPKLR